VAALPSKLLYFIVIAISIAVLRTRLESPVQRFGAPFRLLSLQLQRADRVLAMPVRTVSVTRVANTWQAPRPNGRRHEGVDIFARSGTPVLSVAEGIVSRIGENGLGGKIVTVAGRGGRAYYYAHLDDYGPDLAVGDTVHQNTVLGFIGNTGNARTTPPHLHFGVYTVSGAINPLPLLVDRAVRRDGRNASLRSRSSMEFLPNWK
jgi:peptidoglycan LD-endopeptidase LytH